MKQIAIIYGTESYLRERHRREFLQACRQRAGEDMDIQTAERDISLSRLAEMIGETGLFCRAAVTICREDTLLRGKHKGASRKKMTAEEEWFLQRLAHFPEENGLLFYREGMLDEKDPFFRALSALATVWYCPPVSSKEIMRYVNAFFQEQGHTLTAQGTQYLQNLFATWQDISLQYIYTEIQRICLQAEAEAVLDVADLQGMFSGAVEKNIFSFLDFFFSRKTAEIVSFFPGLFNPKVFLKSVGAILTQLHILLEYKELTAMGMSERQAVALMQEINKGCNVKGIVWHLKKKEKYWTIKELRELIAAIFKLQVNLRRGIAEEADMGPLLCLYSSGKR